MDLQDPRCRDRPADDRLLDRILTREERSWLDRVSREDRGGEPWLIRLWALWAAKEAAFKVRCKELSGGGGPFLPRALICELDAADPEDGGPVRIGGIVHCPDLPDPVTVTGTSNGRHVHVLGWSGAADRPSGGRLETGLEEVETGGAEALERLRGRFTEGEWEGVYSVPSAIARLRARERIVSLLESANGVMNGAGRDSGSAGGAPAGPVEILTPGARPGQVPPKIRAGGRELDGWDVSLSHHGRYVAWGLLIPD